MCDSNFVFEELNKELAICHEIFGKFTIDSRVRLFFLMLVAENMPATARGSSQSSRARETSKLSHFTILWYQARVGMRLFFTREWTCRWPKKSWTT